MSKGEKKRGGSFAIIVMILIVIIVLLVIFGKGFGLGGGSGDGDSVPAAGTVSESETTAETPAETENINYVEVTVSEDSYIYENNTVELPELIEKLKTAGCEVHINVEDSATANALDRLHTELDGSGIVYSDIIPEN